MLDAEVCRHGELCTLLDLEGLVLEGGLAAGGGEVNGDGATARRVHGERVDDADAGVIGIREILSAGETKRLLVALKRLVVCV